MEAGAFYRRFLPKQFRCSRRFKSRSLFYLECDEVRELNAPLLTLIGARDDWASASRCKETLSQAKSDYDVDLQIYPEAYHVFDLEGIDQQQLGHILRYNADAASDAIMKVHSAIAKPSL